DGQGILSGVQAGFQGVVGIDQRQVYLIQYTGQGGSFQLADADVVRVVGDVARGRQNIAVVLQRDHPGLGQQQQGSAAVGGIIGNGHGGAIRDAVQVGQLAGIDAEGFDVDVGNTGQVGAAALVELIQIRLVL